MKSLPLPFDFEEKGVLDLELLVKNRAFFTVAENIPAANPSCFFKENCFVSSNNSFGEPTSVLDSTVSGGPTSSSTLSSSHGGVGGGGGGGASTDTAGLGLVSDTNPSPISSNTGGADSDLLPVPPYLETGNAAGDDWENVLSAASPSQEQSIFRWIMGDIVEDPAMGNLHEVLQVGGGGGCPVAPEFEFGGGFGVVDQADQFGPNFIPAVSIFPSNIRSSTEKTILPSNTIYHSAFDSSLLESKPPIFNLINHHQAQQTQNPSFSLPFQQEQRLVNGGVGAKWSFPDSQPQPMLTSRQQQTPHHLPQQMPVGPVPNPKTGRADELGHVLQQQRSIIDHLYDVAELVQTGHFVFAQGILARLNHSLSPIGNPFNRAAFYCKEALQSLLTKSPSTGTSSPFSLISKIGAHKSFSEISPSIEFADFTCNQALLDAFEGFGRIHIVDFDIGYGGQWAPLMQELAMRGGGPPELKITALVGSRRDHLELSLVRENLIHFAGETNIEFEFAFASVDSFRVSGDEAVGVNLPIGCLADYNLPLPSVLRFVKQMSPRIVVSVDGGCERTDLPFAGHIIHAVRSYSNLLESLDAVNVNPDAMRRIERFVIQPGIEKIVTGRFRSPEKSEHWRNLYLSSGFSPVGFSDLAEAQGECIVRRAHVRGFQVEKRQSSSSLVLCWQRKELVSVSAWRC